MISSSILPGQWYTFETDVTVTDEDGDVFDVVDGPALIVVCDRSKANFKAFLIDQSLNSLAWIIQKESSSKYGTILGFIGTEKFHAKVLKLSTNVKLKQNYCTKTILEKAKECQIEFIKNRSIIEALFDKFDREENGSERKIPRNNDRGRTRTVKILTAFQYS